MYNISWLNTLRTYPSLSLGPALKENTQQQQQHWKTQFSCWQQLWLLWLQCDVCAPNYLWYVVQKHKRPRSVSNLILFFSHSLRYAGKNLQCRRHEEQKVCLNKPDNRKIHVTKCFFPQRIGIESFCVWGECCSPILHNHSLIRKG